MIVIILAVVILAVLTVASWTVLYRLRRQEAGPTEECAGADLDGITYRPCGRTLTARQAHVLVDTWDEGEGAGSGVSVAYCERHCPGGCRRGCRERDKAERESDPDLFSFDDGPHR